MVDLSITRLSSSTTTSLAASKRRNQLPPKDEVTHLAQHTFLSLPLLLRQHRLLALLGKQARVRVRP